MPEDRKEELLRVAEAAIKEHSAMLVHDKVKTGTYKGIGDPWLYSLDDAGNITVLNSRDPAASWRKLPSGSESYEKAMTFIANPKDRLTHVSAKHEDPVGVKFPSPADSPPVEEDAPSPQLSSPKITGAKHAKAVSPGVFDSSSEPDPLAKARTHSSADKAAIAKHRAATVEKQRARTAARDQR